MVLNGVYLCSWGIRRGVGVLGRCRSGGCSGIVEYVVVGVCC